MEKGCDIADATEACGCSRNTKGTMRMRKTLLMATAVLLAMTVVSKADIVANLGLNPTSGAGAFSNTNPGTGGGGSGLFADIYNFTLDTDQTLTIAFAINTFASTPQFIGNFTGSVVYEGADGQIGGGDDQVVIGPTLATACLLVPNCQGFGGSANLNSGEYHLLITGNAGELSGYGGDLSTFAVPGPLAGAGLPGLIAACGMMLGLARHRRRKA
jgi:hypothetical protein